MIDFKPIASMFMPSQVSTQRLDSEYQEVVVVFNRINHASLVAAVMHTLALRESGSEVTMIDIRDDYCLSGVDQYFWIDTQILGTNAKVPRLVDELSTHLNVESMDLTEPLSGAPEDLMKPTVVDTVYRRLCDLDLMPSGKKALYNQIRLLARSFQSTLNDAVGCCAYYDIIDHALEFYFNHTQEDFSEDLLRPDHLRVKNFMMNQQSVSMIIKRRLATENLAGAPVYMVTDTDKTVYGTLRRIMFSKKDYVHVSLGTHGKFIQSNLALVPNEKWISRLRILDSQH